MQCSVWRRVSFVVRWVLRLGIAGHVVSFTRVTVIFHPLVVNDSSCCPTFLPACGIASFLFFFFNLTLLIGCHVTESHCDFDWHFPSDYWWWISFTCLFSTCRHSLATIYPFKLLFCWLYFLLCPEVPPQIWLWEKESTKKLHSLVKLMEVQVEMAPLPPMAVSVTFPKIPDSGLRLDYFRITAPPRIRHLPQQDLDGGHSHSPPTSAVRICSLGLVHRETEL